MVNRPWSDAAGRTAGVARSIQFTLLLAVVTGVLTGIAVSGLRTNRPTAVG